MRACDDELEGGEAEPDGLAFIWRSCMSVEEAEAEDFFDVVVCPGGYEET